MTAARLPRSVSWLHGIALAAAIACGGGGRTSVTPAPASDAGCVVVPRPATTAGFITAVFTSNVDARRAPNPTTPAEQFLFGHAYEPLIRVSCRGEIVAGLAKSWNTVEPGRRLRLVLRADARFWNGDPVTAADVVASWRSTGQAPIAVSARRMADAATVVDDSTLEIRGQVEIRTLGSPELAIARRSPDARWPLGTGSHRVQDVSARVGVPQRTTVLLEPISGSTLPRIAVTLTTPADGRDLIDGGADVVITDDRSLSAYRATRPGVVSSLLDSPTTWLLVSQAPLSNDSSATVDASRTAALRESLAQLVVRAQARPAPTARWYPSAAGCEATSPPLAATRGRSATRVVYPYGEPVAQALAERLVALAASGEAQLASIAPELARTGARTTAAAMMPNDFDAALRAGTELAYIVAIPRIHTASCLGTEALVAVAPWLMSSTGARHFSGVVSPLIETRPMAVINLGRAGFILSGDGSIRAMTTTPSPPNQQQRTP